MDWDKLKTFYAVAEAGSFTSAGERLHLSQSAISRQVIALEQHMGFILFHRHTRGLILTEQGTILYDAVKEIHQRLLLTQSRLQKSKNNPSGVIRVNTPVSLGSMWLAPIIKAFNDMYPDIEVHIVCSDMQMDLSMLEADIGVLQHASTAPGLIQKKIMTNRSFAYASAEYLERYGVPKKIADLDFHKLIAFDCTLGVDNDYNFNWLLEAGRQKKPARRPIMSINSLHGMYRAVRSGLGVAALPEFMEKLPGGLIRVLPEEQNVYFDVYVVYPQEHRTVSKVQVFKDFLIENAKKKG